MRLLRDGEWIAGGGGLALLAALVLDRRRARGPSDVVLGLLALVPFGLVAAQATRRSPAVPVTFSVLTHVAGAAAAVVSGVRLGRRRDPGGAAGLPAWLGLVASLVVVAGGWRSLRVERIPGAAPPPVESLPAPPPGPPN